ncbi:MAG: methylated-DNA--[protein]-cysteine S-methyltransferase [Actinomycetia bacterium]|nr:methylated-DNA--[protein]-cysteine S-methyltransferase [Actinomycetes bacterium]
MRNISITTKYGNVEVLLSLKGVYSLKLPVFKIDVKSNKERDNEFRLSERLKKYFEGLEVDFSDIPLDLEGFSDFEKKVFYTIIKKVRFGKVRSYSWVAENAGKEKAWRAVGKALGKNRIPIIIPCHRVVRKDGNTGGWSGRKGWKELLLSLEELK